MQYNGVYYVCYYCPVLLILCFVVHWQISQKISSTAPLRYRLSGLLHSISPRVTQGILSFAVSPFPFLLLSLTKPFAHRRIFSGLVESFSMHTWKQGWAPGSPVQPEPPGKFPVEPGKNGVFKLEPRGFSSSGCPSLPGNGSPNIVLRKFFVVLPVVWLPLRHIL